MSPGSSPSQALAALVARAAAGEDVSETERRKARKRTARPRAGTAAEAVEGELRKNKQLSSRINYDVVDLLARTLPYDISLMPDGQHGGALIGGGVNGGGINGGALAAPRPAAAHQGAEDGRGGGGLGGARDDALGGGGLGAETFSETLSEVNADETLQDPDTLEY